MTLLRDRHPAAEILRSVSPGARQVAGTTRTQERRCMSNIVELEEPS